MGGGGQVHLIIVTTNSYHQVTEQAEYGLPHVLQIQNKVSLLRKTQTNFPQQSIAAQNRSSYSRRLTIFCPHETWNFRLVMIKTSKSKLKTLCTKITKNFLWK